MPSCWPYWPFGGHARPDPAAPRVGRPKRDRTKIKAGRKAARR